MADGWQTVDAVNQIHMNYGWADGFTTWYTVDALHQPGGGTPYDEYTLLGIVPVSALGNNVSGTITPNPWEYRYVDQDANVDDAEFTAGVKLQFLPGVRLRPTGLNGGTLRFYGAPGQDTLLFSHGDKTKGIRSTMAESKDLPAGPMPAASASRGKPGRKGEPKMKNLEHILSQWRHRPRYSAPTCAAGRGPHRRPCRGHSAGVGSDRWCL